MTPSSEKKPPKRVSLAERKAQLQSRLAQIEARERDVRRKEATRIRIVLGAVLVARATKMVEQRDPKAAAFLHFLQDLSMEITRPADAAAKASIEQLLGELESEMAKLRLAEQSSSAASPKLADPAQTSLQPVQKPSQPSQAQQPFQPVQQPFQPVQKPSQPSQAQQPSQQPQQPSQQPQQPSQAQPSQRLQDIIRSPPAVGHWPTAKGPN